MHNIGSTQTEYAHEGGAFSAEQFEYNEAGEFGHEGSYEGEYHEAEYQEGVFSPEAEAELAAEFMEISTEAELDRFLGKLIRGAGRAIGRVVRSPIGRAVGGMLKGVARKALPMAGAALGNLVLPGVGGAMGGQLASAAGRMFGLELEGLSPEDREYEISKRFVHDGEPRAAATHEFLSHDGRIHEFVHCHPSPEPGCDRCGRILRVVPNQHVRCASLQ